MLYDVFISHASDDKEDFVRPLAKKLSENGIEIWYDEFSLKPGNSIRRSIDAGIAKSRYGIIVLSKAFFQKEWTQWELDGLIQRLNRTGNNNIIPIWHKIVYDDIFKYSASLADIRALFSSNGIPSVVSEIIKIVKPEGSTLLNARDVLLNYGMNPPVVTDDWWLDVVAFSSLNFTENPWGFPYDNAITKSQKIAWAAMQMTWQQKRKERGISQISHPEEVLKFIKESSGLEEICHLYPDYLAANAPQLTIPGFGGQFEEDFEKEYISSQKDCAKEEEDIKFKDSIPCGCVAKPECYLWYALRHSKFGNWNSHSIAGFFISASGGASINAHVQIYYTTDYLFWLLTEQSNYLPKTIHQCLLDGFKHMHWIWYGSAPWDNEKLLEKEGITGELAYALQKAKSYDEFIFTEKCKSDLKAMINHSKKKIQFHESIEDIYKKFVDMDFIAHWSY